MGDRVMPLAHTFVEHQHAARCVIAFLDGVTEIRKRMDHFRIAEQVLRAKCDRVVQTVENDLYPPHEYENEEGNKRREDAEENPHFPFASHERKNRPCERAQKEKGQHDRDQKRAILNDKAALRASGDFHSINLPRGRPLAKPWLVAIANQSKETRL